MSECDLTKIRRHNHPIGGDPRGGFILRYGCPRCEQIKAGSPICSTGAKIVWPISLVPYIAHHDKEPKGYGSWRFFVSGDVTLEDVSRLCRSALNDRSLIKWGGCEVKVGLPIVVRFNARLRFWHAKLAVSQLIQRTLDGRNVVIELAP